MCRPCVVFRASDVPAHRARRAIHLPPFQRKDFALDAPAADTWANPITGRRAGGSGFSTALKRVAVEKPHSDVVLGHHRNCGYATVVFLDLMASRNARRTMSALDRFLPPTPWPRAAWPQTACRSGADYSDACRGRPAVDVLDAPLKCPRVLPVDFVIRLYILDRVVKRQLAGRGRDGHTLGDWALPFSQLSRASSTS